MIGVQTGMNIDLLEWIMKSSYLNFKNIILPAVESKEKIS